MANDGTKTQTQTHVPAWKRLGLKLKYASEDVGENATATADTTAAAAAPADSIEEAKGADTDKKKDKKKRKKNASEDGEGSHAAATGTEETGNNKKRRLENGVAAGVSPGEEKQEQKQELHGNNAAATPQRKSVSFTPDTKDGDGDGKAQSGDKEQQNGDEDMDEEERKKEEIRQKKREKKRKKRQEAKARQQSSQNNSNAATSVDDSPILSYLTRFYEDRSSWKFQKNRESHLLKHALSLERVPVRFNTPLLVYLQGLRSEGAKQRLRQAAEEVVSADDDQWKLEVANIDDDDDDNGHGESEQNNNNSPTSGTSGEKYREAVEAFRARLAAGDKDLENGSTLEGADADTQKRLERRQRAELILWAINGKASSPTETKATSPKVENSSAKADGKNVKNNDNKKNTPTTAPKKKRKNRTAVVEISSSSSDSDSDSDS